MARRATPAPNATDRQRQLIGRRLAANFLTPFILLAVGLRRMTLVRRHIAFDFGFQLGHVLAAGHQVSDLLAALFALAEVGGLGAADQHGEMVADGPTPLVGSRRTKNERPMLISGNMPPNWCTVAMPMSLASRGVANLTGRPFRPKLGMS